MTCLVWFRPAWCGPSASMLFSSVPSGVHLHIQGMRVSVKNGFLTRLNGKRVEVKQRGMGNETVKVKLSSRAVVKEQGLGDMCLHKRGCTQVETQLERRLSPEQDTDSHGRCV